MSRVARNPLTIPANVEIDINDLTIKVKGTKGVMSFQFLNLVTVSREGNLIHFVPKVGANQADAVAGTTRALVNNMIEGVTKGFERQLQLVGVGYRAQVQGKHLHLTVGFSHPVKYPIPAGIIIETPSQTEVVVKGMDKQLVGQVAAHIRAYRPPEPYKGKGIRYSNEIIIKKEGKKK